MQTTQTPTNRPTLVGFKVQLIIFQATPNINFHPDYTLQWKEKTSSYLEKIKDINIPIIKFEIDKGIIYLP